MDAAAPASSAARERPLLGSLRGIAASPWFQLVAAFVVVGLILSFVAKPYWVPSGSMEPTLQPGDRVLVNRLAYAASAPQRGDIVVFDADDAWEGAPAEPSGPVVTVLRWLGEVTGFGPSGAHTLIKRVIGTPGERIACCDAAGRVTVDGVGLDEPYLFSDFVFEPGRLDCTTTPRSLQCFDEVTVPEDSYLVMGDNRAASSDSVALCRGEGAAEDCARWADRADVVGRAVVILWPPGRWTGL